MIKHLPQNEYTGEKSNSEYENFETLKHNTADNTPDIPLDTICNPDANFFNVNFQNFDTLYLLPEKFHDFLDNTSPDYFFMLQLNIRTIKKTTTTTTTTKK